MIPCPHFIYYVLLLKPSSGKILVNLESRNVSHYTSREFFRIGLNDETVTKYFPLVFSN